MKYQYRFKDKSLEQALNVIYGEEFVEDEVNRQMTNTTSYICFDLDHSSTTISKGEIAEINEYNPDAWNPYPAVKPSASGLYFITVKIKDQPDAKPFVTVGCLDPFGYWEKYTDSEVLAFRELPEAYEKEEGK